MRENNIPWEERNLHDARVALELETRGGKRQVPYMVDPERNVEMYESLDIIDYVARTYAPSATLGEVEEIRTCPIVEST